MFKLFIAWVPVLAVVEQCFFMNCRTPQPKMDTIRNSTLLKHGNQNLP